MKSIAVLQARVNSTRLPAKSLLPIRNIPIVVLAAKRAANTGRRVLVCTSIERSDDLLCQTLDFHGIEYFRGDLNNVLKRFVSALSNLPSDTKVFRLTADNILPDGELLELLEEQFDEKLVDIICCDSDKTNLPYGLSAELTTLGWLRMAYENTNDARDLEHVTPYIYRIGRSVHFDPPKYGYHKKLRVTIDCLDDYLNMAKLFQGVPDPVNAQIDELLVNRRFMEFTPVCKNTANFLTLGGAQFGQRYGITNETGAIEGKLAEQIIRQAITEGIEYIDTAAGYGNSEIIIGKALKEGWGSRVKLITKLPTFDNLQIDMLSSGVLCDLVHGAIYTSLHRLGLPKIDCIMLHRAHQIDNPYIIEALHRAQQSGIIDKIGVSVQNPEELSQILDKKFVSVIQMPFNILDYRWGDLIPHLRKMRLEREVVVHARSSLFQGLLCSNDKEKWLKAGIKNYMQIRDWLSECVRDFQMPNTPALCLSFVRSQDWIDSVVVGVESKEQLVNNINHLDNLLSINELHEIETSRPEIRVHSLNPANWKKHV